MAFWGIEVPLKGLTVNRNEATYCVFVYISIDRLSWLSDKRVLTTGFVALALSYRRRSFSKRLAYVMQNYSIDLCQKCRKRGMSSAQKLQHKEINYIMSAERIFKVKPNPFLVVYRVYINSHCATCRQKIWKNESTWTSSALVYLMFSADFTGVPGYLTNNN